MIEGLLNRIRGRKPLVHHITNIVTVNDCANITLAIGGLPVMAHAIEEVEEMVAASQALVLNIGTLTREQVDAMIMAGRTANSLGIPVILDPVGAGATAMRTESAKRIMRELRLSVIKGNIAEIGILAGAGGKIRGVEAEGGHGDVGSYKRLAMDNGCIIAASGVTDIITDGKRVAYVDNGHPMMGTITGTGCMLTSVVGCFCGAESDYFDATVAAFASFGLAGELAAAHQEVNGPGSFRAAFFDEIYNLTEEKLKAGKKVKIE
ncbi:hydroxyethylthiazole kinase [Calorimonas adulescens]|uniref:Hydroxyethylthiazole kinase n=1 Tax=Calorimonas adulescens TaxID=2606906 RepID=A0A5D8Q8N3_9THEO|nr:hydroxyethylthiazole kinase [Calorimonas adulescens]TZE81135.1 hydroxyethylthiazole kinase [Calorimonas adulescens]